MTELAALCFLKWGGVGGPGRGLTPFRAEPGQQPPVAASRRQEAQVPPQPCAQLHPVASGTSAALVAQRPGQGSVRTLLS